MAETKKQETEKSALQRGRAWYVLRAISGKEGKVKEVLEGQMRNTPMGERLFQVVIPTEKVMTVRNGKKVVKEKNLYSGYVFIEADLTGELIYELRNTTNVIDFLYNKPTTSKENPLPEPLRESEVKRMLGAADSLAEAQESGNDYMVGETVKVTYGPFSQFSGTVEEVNREKKKLTVMVKIFGRKTPIELDNTQVERE